MNCQMPLVEVVVFVKIGCQLDGAFRFVVIQSRLVVSGMPTKFNVTLPSALLTRLVTSGVTTVSETTLLVTLPNTLVMTTEYLPADAGVMSDNVSDENIVPTNGKVSLKYH